MKKGKNGSGRKTKKKIFSGKQEQKRVPAILDVIFSYAKLSYNKKARVYGDGTYIDAVATGINMLGEELKSSTISLHEKEILIREIHHRVKNNLSIISSLINIQSAKAKDEYHRQLFEDCRNRLMAISYIHQQLYMADSLTDLSFKNYISDIIYLLESSFNNEQIKITTDLDPVQLNIDKALPCSLILNELITNCYKHAFGARKKRGEIKITMKNKNRNVEISVKDNGRGFVEKKTENYSAGLSLIRDLVQQIDGRMEIKNGQGAEVKFSFRG